jgi:hypothetical protein
MTITAIKLVREHHGEQKDAVVYAEIGGKFIEMIREEIDGCFSHIIERSGINQLAAFALSTEDLIASGGIVDAP